MKVPDKFVDELKALYDKWGIGVASCGCCPHFVSAGREPEILEGLSEDLRGSDAEFAEDYPELQERWRKLCE